MPDTTSQRVALKNCWPYLLVSDLAETEAFCRQRLGFDVAYEEPDHGFVIYSRDEVYLMFRQAGHDPASLVNARFHPEDFPPDARPFSASIQVSDLDALHAEFTERGATPSPIIDLPYARETMVTLPDGYVLVFMQLKSA